MKHLIYFFAVCVLAFLFIGNANAQVPNKISYQGLLTTSAGTPVTDGSYDLKFDLFKNLSGGSSLWTETHTGVTVQRGTFNVILGSGMTALPDIFNQPLFVEVTALAGPGIPAPITFSPRSELTSAPYSLNLKVPAILSSSNLDGNILKVINNTAGTGIRGEAYSSTSSPSFGIQSLADNTGSGGAAGGRFLTTWPTTGTGERYGVISAGFGASSANVMGIWGYGMNNSSGDAYGGYFSTELAGTGTRYGSYSAGHGSSSAPSYGTYGLAVNTSTGDARGGFFKTSETSRGTGTRFGIDAIGLGGGSSSTYGVKGWSSNNASGYSFGGYFTSYYEPGNTSWNYGSYSEGVSTGSAGAVGVQGLADNDGTGSAWSGWFLAGAADVGTGARTGVLGSAYARGTGLARGVMGYAANSVGAGEVYGGYFYTDIAGTGNHYGLYANGVGSSNAVTYGLKADVSNSSTGWAYAGHFRTSSTTRGTGGRIGVLGQAYGATTSPVQAIAGYAENTGTGDVFAGIFEAGSAGTGTKYGIYSSAPTLGSSMAGYFYGNVRVTGSLSKGSGSFKIDHPLDPENKYLYHSFVESPDMMNIYNGNIVLDSRGEAVIELPKYFDALNKDFRYQLTCIGGYANVYVAEKINNNRFKIAGGSPGLEVSWQVTGVRKDKFAEANRIQVEVDKPAHERGKYLHPDVFGLSDEKGLHYEMYKQMAEERQRQLEESIKRATEQKKMETEMREQVQRDLRNREKQHRDMREFLEKEEINHKPLNEDMKR